MALDYASLPDDLEELKQQLLKHAAWVESLKAEVLRLKRWRYGRSAEAIDLSIAPELPLGEGAVAPVTSASATEAPPIPRLVSVDEPQPRRLGRRAPRTLPAELPRVVRVHAPERCTCPECGDVLRQLGEDASEQLD